MSAAVQTTAAAAVDGPIVKRQKLAVAQQRNETRHGPGRSRIFAPFRTVGLVSPTAVPFSSVPLGKTTFQITTSVGRCLQTYDLRRGLNLVFITRPQTPENITATLAWKDKVLAAWGGDGPGASRGIWIFRRGKKVADLELPKDFDENINQLVVFGTWVVGRGETRIEVWKSSNLEHYTTLSAPFSQGSGSKLTGGICSMPTYLNKIFAGRQNGSVEIWNISTGKLLYTIFPAAADYGAVTALEPTPALSLLAIAYQKGPVVIQDVRADKEILAFNTGSSQRLPVSSISFRTDGLGAGEDGQRSGVMATASRENGDVTLWDLNNGGRKMGVLRGAHNPPSTTHGLVAGGISKIEFLAGQAVLMTSGLDNSLKSWIFDEQPFSPIPRILHSRSGHAAPVSSLQFLPSDADGADAGGKWIMSASRDRSLWGWSLRRDGQSTELSQGNIRKQAKKMGILSSGLASLDSSTTLEDLKAPKITCMACSLNQDGGMGAMPGTKTIWNRAGSKKGANSVEGGTTGWESVVTGHEGDKMARTWFWGRKRAGRWIFETGDGAEVKSVAVSPCGTFALIGSAAGGIDMFNLQSGIHRQRFPAKLTPKQAQQLKIQQAEREVNGDEPKKFTRGLGKHTKTVTGIEVDSLNRTVISCGLDGKVKFWDFSSGTLLHEIDWYPMTTITGLRFYRPSDLIGLSCSDDCIRIVDITTRKLVRELWDCEGDINDFTFSNDGRWVVAASSDHVLRVWDLPTGHLIDAIKLRSLCTAVAFSNTGEYLATAQEDNVGINIWTNRTLFTHVPTRHISNKEITDVDAPTASGEGGENLVTAANTSEEEVEDDVAETAVPSLEQLSKDMTTLSLVPKLRWQNLVNLDIIRERNKPKEVPKPPEKAPFFLPSLGSAGDSANPGANPASSSLDKTPVAAESSKEMSRISKLESMSRTDNFATVLRTASQTHIYGPLVEHLKTFPPSRADLAIRSLYPIAPYSELITFVHALSERLRARRDYELVQAWMAVFLRLHGDVVAVDEGVRDAVKAWREEQQKEQERLGRLVGYCNGVVGFLRSVR